jgi:hypothetical protein
VNNRQQLTDDQVFRIYHLMRGGVDETEPLQLATLAGVSAFGLTRDFLGHVFVEGQRRFGGLRWTNPTRRVSASKGRQDNEPRPLATRRQVDLLCRNCGRKCGLVPCPHCPRGNPPRLKAERRGNRDFAFYNTGVGYRSTDDLIAEHEKKYDGGGVVFVQPHNQKREYLNA